jgi:murein DD-endopeptidase MepM/ murein hydrolase activator NlpD
VYTYQVAEFNEIDDVNHVPTDASAERAQGSKKFWLFGLATILTVAIGFVVVWQLGKESGRKEAIKTPSTTATTPKKIQPVVADRDATKSTQKTVASTTSETTDKTTTAPKPSQGKVASTAKPTSSEDLIEVCPVNGKHSGIDTFGAPQANGRIYDGVMIMAKRDTPVVAPVSGKFERSPDPLGGNAFRIYGDNGHFYYGAHLGKYAGADTDTVKAGDLIGYVGNTGRSTQSGPTLLHLQIHKGGRDEPAINPTEAVAAKCPGVDPSIKWRG